MLPRQRHPWPRRLWPARQEAAREVAPAAVVDRSGILRPSGPPFLARLATGESPATPWKLVRLTRQPVQRSGTAGPCRAGPATPCLCSEPEPTLRCRCAASRTVSLHTGPVQVDSAPLPTFSSPRAKVV